MWRGGRGTCDARGKREGKALAQRAFRPALLVLAVSLRRLSVEGTIGLGKGQIRKAAADNVHVDISRARLPGSAVCNLVGTDIHP